MKKRISLPTDSFGSETDFLATLERKSENAEQKSDAHVKHLEIVSTNTEKQENLVQFTTYLKEKHEETLEEVAEQYNKNHNRKRQSRVTRHDIIRYLIDTLSLEQILRAEISPAKNKKQGFKVTP